MMTSSGAVVKCPVQKISWHKPNIESRYSDEDLDHLVEFKERNEASENVPHRLNL